jgi:hypothetical protein
MQTGLRAEKVGKIMGAAACRGSMDWWINGLVDWWGHGDGYMDGWIIGFEDRWWGGRNLAWVRAIGPYL